MTSNEVLSRIEIAKHAVSSQTARLHEGFGRAESHWKHDQTRVTPVDIAISDAIQAQVEQAFPDDQFFSEERSPADGPIPVTSRFSWVLDPIDGTNNFALGLSHCAISLALLENGSPIYGVVYDHSRRSLMEGGPGFGCRDGGREVTLKTPQSGKPLWVAVDSLTRQSSLMERMNIIAHVQIRSLGSGTLNLAYAAAGLLDGSTGHVVKVWDIAAAAALCLGAGGEIHFPSGDGFPLKTFDVKQPGWRYFAGNPAACRLLAQYMHPKPPAA